jgi:DGQHR domain-containing protein
MSTNDYIKFKCVEVCQPIGTFYVGTIDSKNLVEIAYADAMRIKDKEDDLDQYLGIQRELSPGRVTELKNYVNTIDATFPTSVILSISSEHASFNEKTGEMELKNEPGVAKIIDGQHRIAGLKNYTEESPFHVNVTIFIDMDLEDQAMVFATINIKQTKVSKSLMYNLFDYATTRSPQKSCHDIAKLLNYKNGSPFQDRIKILGKATGKSETITQATFVEELMKYMSNDPMGDRDRIKRKRKLLRIGAKETKKLIFRNMFIDNKDAEIARIIYNYFTSVQNKWGNYWIQAKPGNILNKTTGFVALMKFLRPCYLLVGKLDEIVNVSEFDKIFRRIEISGDSFTPDNYKPGATGQTDLFKAFCEKSGLTNLAK